MEVGEVPKGIRWSAEAGGPPKVRIGGVSGRGQGPTIKGAFYCGVPTLSEGGSHSHILLWQVPISFFSRLHESSNPRPQGPILKWGALSLPTELAQLVVRVLPTSI